MYHFGTQIIPMMSLKSSQKETKIMTQRETLLEMFEKLWNADKDKFTWNVILKDTLEKIETNNDTKR